MKGKIEINQGFKGNAIVIRMMPVANANYHYGLYVFKPCWLERLFGITWVKKLDAFLRRAKKEMADFEEVSELVEKKRKELESPYWQGKGLSEGKVKKGGVNTPPKTPRPPPPVSYPHPLVKAGRENLNPENQNIGMPPTCPHNIGVGSFRKTGDYRKSFIHKRPDPKGSPPTGRPHSKSLKKKKIGQEKEELKCTGKMPV